ncbi:MAG: hypothetical protein HY347_00430 [candidate division NC10 bacterium]|nr:hypothetical protein [candidate division NC10 bacterium]
MARDSRSPGLFGALFGVLVYHLVERELPSVGASLPSLVAAFLLHLLLSEAARRAEGFASSTPPQ